MINLEARKPGKDAENGATAPDADLLAMCARQMFKIETLELQLAMARYREKELLGQLLGIFEEKTEEES